MSLNNEIVDADFRFFDDLRELIPKLQENDLKIENSEQNIAENSLLASGSSKNDIENDQDVIKFDNFSYNLRRKRAKKVEKLETCAKNDTLNQTLNYIFDADTKPSVNFKPTRRKSLSLDVKLEAVKVAEISGQRFAAKLYNVDEKSIRDWRRKKSKLLDELRKGNSQRQKISGGGRKPQYSNIESILMKKILEMRAERKPFTWKMIQKMANKLWAKLNKNLHTTGNNSHVTQFSASNGWIHKFMKRNGLSLKSKNCLENERQSVNELIDFVVQDTERKPVHEHDLEIMPKNQNQCLESRDLNESADFKIQSADFFDQSADIGFDNIETELTNRNEASTNQSLESRDLNESADFNPQSADSINRSAVFAEKSADFFDQSDDINLDCIETEVTNKNEGSKKKGGLKKQSLESRDFNESTDSIGRSAVFAGKSADFFDQSDEIKTEVTNKNEGFKKKGGPKNQSFESRDFNESADSIGRSAVFAEKSADFFDQSDDINLDDIETEVTNENEASKKQGGAKKRTAYDFETKLQAVECAKKHGNYYTARLYEVDEKRVRDWRKKEQLMRESRDCHRKKLAGSGRKPLNHQLEAVLYEKLDQLKADPTQQPITGPLIRRMANEIHQQMNPGHSFVASNGWLQNFLKRHNISLQKNASSTL